MNPLTTGWFESYVMILSAVMALGWVIGKPAAMRTVMVPSYRPLKSYEPRVQCRLWTDTDTDTLSLRRKFIQQPSSLP